MKYSPSDTRDEVSAPSDYVRSVDEIFGEDIAFFEQQSKISSQMLDMLNFNFSTFLDLYRRSFEKIYEAGPNPAFMFITEIIQIVSMAAASKPLVQARMTELVSAIRPDMSRIGCDIGASGFTIELGIPTGASVAFHFEVDTRKRKVASS